MSQLGYPDHGKYDVAATPYDSKLGGKPVWFRNKNPDSKPNICSLCGSELYMVAQIYAPVDFARSLAIFGCNRQQCSKVSSTWRVIRTQDISDQNPWKSASTLPVDNLEDETTGGGSTIEVKVKREQKEKVEKVDTSQTNEMSFGGSGWENAGGGWGDTGGFSDTNDGFGSLCGLPITTNKDDKVTDNSTTDLETLLQKRDQSLKMGKSEKLKKGKSNSIKRKKGKSAPVLLSSSTAKLSIPPTTESSSTTTTSTPATSSTVSFPEMFLYVDVEPEGNSKRVSNDSVERAVQRHMKRHGNTIPSNASATSGDGYIETPAREKALQKYQQRIVRAPKQCLRYAYNTVPLWPSPPEDMQENVSKVPRCVCGAKRVFELQLLSTVLHELNVDRVEEKRGKEEGKQNSEKKKNGNKKVGGCGKQLRPEQTRQMMMNNGGMDWSTLLVYSCENSCIKSCNEIAIVHPPL